MSEKPAIALSRIAYRYAWPLLLAALVVLLGLAVQIPQLDIDASPDSLLLENDRDLQYYRELHREYGSDEYLIVAIELNEPFFNRGTIESVEKLTAKIAQLQHVQRVTSPTNVPLLQQKQEDKDGNLVFPTLGSGDADIQAAAREMPQNPLYINNLLSTDASTIALIVYLQENQALSDLIAQRYQIHQSKEEPLRLLNSSGKLARINQKIEQLRNINNENYTDTIVAIRDLVAQQSMLGQFYLAGAPMVASDIQKFVLSDIRIFGMAMLIILSIVLLYFFRTAQWVLIIMGCALLNVFTVSGIIALLGFKLTVISSNYVALLMIFSIALSVHIIVRFEESQARHNSNAQESLDETLQKLFAPCAYMVISSTVAFFSLLISGIQPVIDFGYIMMIGLCSAFAISFLVLPALIAVTRPRTGLNRYTGINQLLASIVSPIIHYPKRIAIGAIILGVAGVAGTQQLTVENRFIDYFKSDTEIYQGLEFVDQHLGGTVPLEIILLHRPDGHSDAVQEKETDDDYFTYIESQTDPLADLNDWYSRAGIDQIRSLHAYLETIPQIGKVLSLSTTEDLLVQLNDGQRLEDFELALLYQRLPESIRKILLDPYLSQTSDQSRILARIRDSDRSLIRNELLGKVAHGLNQQLTHATHELRLSGISVLYNNLLQSLFRSQILTLGTVFFCIMIMLTILFRSISLAAIGTIPNVFSAVMILGLMGWLDIPLNIMTITIAAITIGIGVDDEIHYIHRFRQEMASSGDYTQAILSVQTTVGKALYFTSVTVTLGFAIMAVSNFIPSVYFGLFTSAAMLISLTSTFTVLPLLILLFQPLPKLATKQHS